MGRSAYFEALVSLLVSVPAVINPECTAISLGATRLRENTTRNIAGAEVEAQNCDPKTLAPGPRILTCDVLFRSKDP